jgi:hypothetical protein
MIRDENIYCVKLISNSFKKISNNQVAELCHKLNLPIEFFIDMRDFGYSKVWFSLSKDLENTTLNPFAYQFVEGDILNFDSDQKISEMQKVVINNCSNIKIAKIDEKVDEKYINKINQYIECKKYSVVIKDFNWEFSEVPEPNVNWAKTIRINIQKYNDDQLITISKQYQITEWHLLYLKKLKAICVYWDTTKPFFLAFQLKEDKELFLHENYKGLKLWNSFYSFLTKKDKDKLLKILPIELNTKKSSIIKKNEATIEKQIIEKQLSIDVILDKIIATGLSSLTKEEIRFLDSFSN